VNKVKCTESTVMMVLLLVGFRVQIQYILEARAHHYFSFKSHMTKYSPKLWKKQEWQHFVHVTNIAYGATLFH
jgi:hypothetical protein